MGENSRKQNSKHIIGWIICVVFLVFALVAFTSAGIASGILFLAGGLFICPFFQKKFNDKGIHIKKPITIIAGVVLFLAAVLTFPTSNKTEEDKEIADAVVESSIEEKSVATKALPIAADTDDEIQEESVKENVIELEIESIEEKEAPEKDVEAESQTQPIIELQTQAQTEPQTQQITEPETQTQIEAPTQPQVETQTQPQIEIQTEPQTQLQTEAPTEPQTQPQTEAKVETKGDPYTGNITFSGHYYATPKGKCYHYSAECGGENSEEITWEKAQNLKPCGTCVLK